MKADSAAPLHPPVLSPPLFLLVALAALQPLTLNILMPATPNVARDLATSYGTVQLTLSLYLVTVAIVQLITGPLSDKHGRRPVVLLALSLFTAGCFGAIFAPSIEWLLAARVVQAMGAGTAFTLMRTIVRDTSTRDQAASRIGYVMVSMLVIPMFAPTLGSFIDTHFDWRAIFVLLTCAGLLVLPLSLIFLRETNPQHARVTGAPLLASLPVLLRERRFIAYTILLCMPSGMFFGFLAGAPHVVIDVMGATSQELGYWFACLAVGYMAGNFGSGRFAQRRGLDRLILTGSALALAGTALQVALSYWEPWTPAMIYIPAMLVSAGNGLTIPCAMAGAISVRPEMAGAASGLSGAAQLGFGAIVSFGMGKAVEPWPRSLVLMMFGCALVGVAAQWLLGARPRSPHAEG